MKHLKPFLFALGLLIALGSCKTNYQKDLLQSAIWYQSASEYRALAFQAYNVARVSLEVKLRYRYVQPPCIVLDLDETCLNNSPYSGYQIKEDKGYSSEDWKRWVEREEADSIPGCVGFLKYADQQGVDIFYVSNRKAAQLEPTMANMKKLDFPQVDADHFYLRTDDSNKEARRQAIEEDHTIIMFFGDNMNDFSEDFEGKSVSERHNLVEENAHRFGVDFIIIPNPCYGSWESALYDYKRLDMKTEDKVKMEKLRSFE